MKQLSLFFLSTILLFLPSRFLSQTWTQLEDYPGLERDDAVAFSIADCGFIVTGNHSGFSESNELWKYSTSSNQWSKLTDFPGIKRQYAVAFTHNEFAYVLGGISENNIPLNDFYCYNSLTDSWQQLDSFPGVARWSAASAIHHNYAYVFGGSTLANTLNDAWRYAFETKSWESLPAVPTVGKRDQLCCAIGEKIYLSTGFSINPLVFHSETYSYNTRTDSWNAESNFPSIPIGYGTVANSVGKAIVLGGLHADGSYSDEAWLFDGMEWMQLTTCLSSGTKGMSAFSINNKFYFLTGIESDLTRSKKFYELSFDQVSLVEIYPNPSDKIVQLTAEIGAKIEIINMFGEKINQHEFAFSNEISLSFDESGVYLVKINFQNGKSECKKLVIL